MSMVQRQPRRECDVFHVGGDVRQMRITIDEWSHGLAGYRVVSESKPDMGQRARKRFWALLNRALTAPNRDPAADPPDQLCLEAQHGAEEDETEGA